MPRTAERLDGRLGAAVSRETGRYLAGSVGIDKYWPPVNRVDNAYGDRNLVCSCPPTEDYMSAAE